MWLFCWVSLNSTKAVFFVASPWHHREDVYNKSCVSRSWTLEDDTDTRTSGQHYTAADRRPTNQVSAWQAGREVAGHAGHARLVADILTKMSRGCYAENGPVKFKLNRALMYIYSYLSVVAAASQSSPAPAASSSSVSAPTSTTVVWQQMVLTTLLNGCRPRYSCVQLVKRAPSVIHFRLSQTQVSTAAD